MAVGQALSPNTLLAGDDGLRLGVAAMKLAQAGSCALATSARHCVTALV